jgi:hypothetical protein
VLAGYHTHPLTSGRPMPRPLGIVLAAVGPRAGQRRLVVEEGAEVPRVWSSRLASTSREAAILPNHFSVGLRLPAMTSPKWLRETAAVARRTVRRSPNPVSRRAEGTLADLRYEPSTLIFPSALNSTIESRSRSM